MDIRATVSIEFAILAPVFFAIMFGVVMFGAEYATRIALTYAAAEGGRAAVSGLSDSERESLATTAIQDTLNAFSPLIESANAVITVNTASESSSEEITISIAYTDDRFANLPFVPQMSSLPPVTVSYFVTDPSD
jgi:Flp pilus assembly protein TadG